MKLLPFAVAGLLLGLAMLWWFPGEWIGNLSLLAAAILGIIATLCEISAILLNGGTLPTRRLQRRPYLYTMLKIGHVTLIFVLCAETGILSIIFIIVWRTLTTH
jgi:hypothetical protein